MTATVFSWVVIVVNLGLVIVNAYHMVQLRRSRKRIDHMERQLRGTMRDFTERVIHGDVRATTDDGVVGTLVVMPEGNGLRITVQPLDDDRVH
jgi:hypothetical protein